MMKYMKVIKFMLLMPVLFAGALAAQPNPEKPKFTISIRAENPEVISGSQFGISITIKNISDESLPFRFASHGDVSDGDRYDVRDEKGASVAKYGRRTVKLPNGETWHIPAPPVGASGAGWIRPGESVEEGSMISEDYNFDHPGKYTIQVSRKESWMQSPIYSNTITITVLPAGSTPSAQQ